MKARVTATAFADEAVRIHKRGNLATVRLLARPAPPQAPYVDGYDGGEYRRVAALISELEDPGAV